MGFTSLAYVWLCFLAASVLGRETPEHVESADLHLVSAEEEQTSADLVQVDSADGMTWQSTAVMERMVLDHLTRDIQAPNNSEGRNYNKSDAFSVQMTAMIGDTRRGVLNSKKQKQDFLDAKVAAVNACKLSQLMQLSQDPVCLGSGKTLSTLNDEKTKCDAKEKDIETQTKKCGVVNDTLKKQIDARNKLISEWASQKFTPDKCKLLQDETKINWLTRMQASINTSKKSWDDAERKSNTTVVFAEKTLENCTWIWGTYWQTQDRCAVLKANVTRCDCQSNQAKVDACKAFAQCYDQNYNIWVSTKKDVEAVEKDMKLEYRGLARMDCYLGAFDLGKSSKSTEGTAKLAACTQLTTDTTVLNINYKTPDPKRNCSVDPSIVAKCR